MKKTKTAKKPSAQEIREATSAVAKAKTIVSATERLLEEARAMEKERQAKLNEAFRAKWDAERRLALLTLSPAALSLLVATRDRGDEPRSGRRPSAALVDKLSNLGLVRVECSSWGHRRNAWITGITEQGLALLKERGL